jgi:hypothetical protein
MSRLDRLKEQHPDLNISLIDIISHLDPTDSYKYTEFLIKNFKRDSDYYSSNKDEFMGYMGIFLFGSGEVETLNEFERHSKANRIKIKDISQYKNFLELNEAVKVAEEIENRKKIEKEILRIYEDDTWLILTPLSFESSKIYGANTKWCVTQERYWNQYLTTHRLIYVINKETDVKFAFSKNFGTERIQSWDSLDNEVDPMVVSFIPDELFLKIRKELQKDKTTGDLIGWGDNVKSIRKISDYPITRDYDTRDYDGVNNIALRDLTSRLLENQTGGSLINDGSGVLNNNNSVPTDIHTGPRLVGTTEIIANRNNNIALNYNDFMNNYLNVHLDTYNCDFINNYVNEHLPIPNDNVITPLINLP